MCPLAAYRRRGIGIDRRFTIYDDGDQLDLVKRAMGDLDLDDKKYRPRSLLAMISVVLLQTTRSRAALPLAG